MTSRGSTWLWDTMSTILVISALVSCASTPGAHRAAPRDPEGSPSVPADEVTRGMHVDQGRLGFDHKLEVRPSKTAMTHELHDGDMVMTGDRIRASAVTSENAYLYVAFCARHELAIYPPQHGVRTTAGAPALVPEGSGELVVDGEPGPEVLYLVVSRTELSLADPRLSAEFAATSQGSKVVDCGASLDAEIARSTHLDGSATGPASSTTHVLRGQVVQKKRMPTRHTRVGRRSPDPPASSSGSSSDHGRPQPAEASAFAPSPNEPDFIRNPGMIVWYGDDGAGASQDLVAADPNGIAVVRYQFTHVAQNSSP